MFHANHVPFSVFADFFLVLYKFTEQMVHSNRYGKNVEKKKNEKEEKRKSSSDHNGPY